MIRRWLATTLNCLFTAHEACDGLSINEDMCGCKCHITPD